MCGISGMANVKDYKTRRALVVALGAGIDSRGGHAAGFVSMGTGTARYARKHGTWKEASRGFIHSAAALDGVTMMHARFATCGKGGPNEAHPFRIEREDRTIWGAHNGVMYGAQWSAEKNKRKFDVDSRELFELLADDKLSDIADSSGWGVLSWIDSRRRDEIRLCKMTKDAALVVVKCKTGEYIYASTHDILKSALAIAGLEIELTYQLETGKQYLLNKEGVWTDDNVPNITLRSAVTHYRGGSWDDDGEFFPYNGYSGGHVAHRFNWTAKTAGDNTNDSKTWAERAEERRENIAIILANARRGYMTERRGSVDGGGPIVLAQVEDPQKELDNLVTAHYKELARDVGTDACPSCRSVDVNHWGHENYCQTCGNSWDLRDWCN